ncbi:hypothetical protein [Thermogymnomonas acidicola]|nr:hypothetical protein [Thermogymnomonas acidicola]
MDKIIDVRSGIKTGANEFFYVTDVTDEYGDEDLKELFGLHRERQRR